MNAKDQMLVAGLAGLVGGELNKVDKLTLESISQKGPTNKINLNNFIPNNMSTQPQPVVNQGVIVDRAPEMIPVPEDMKKYMAQYVAPAPVQNAPGSPTIAQTQAPQVSTGMQSILDSLTRIEEKLDLIIKNTKIRKK